MLLISVLALVVFTMSAIAAPFNATLMSNPSMIKRATPGIANTFSAQEVEQLKRGTTDALKLADAVTAGAKENPKFDRIFSRYFAIKDKKHVLDVFEKILSNDRNQGNVLLGDITFTEDHTDDYYKELSCMSGTMAHTRPDTKPLKPDIVICKSAFKHGAIDHTFKDVADINCKTLGSRVSWHMETLGSILLHEYTHWKHLMSPLFADTKFGATIDDPELGYGPVSVVKLAKKSPSTARNNAENYSWLANDLFWTAHCKKGFERASARMKDDHDPYSKK